jgi:hypothetical protein
VFGNRTSNGVIYAFENLASVRVRNFVPAAENFVKFFKI